MADKKALRDTQIALVQITEQEEALMEELESLKARLQEIENAKQAKQAELEEIKHQMAIDEERKREEEARKKRQQVKAAWREKWTDRIRENGVTFLATLSEAVNDGNKTGLSEADMLNLLRSTFNELTKIKWQNDLLNFYF